MGSPARQTALPRAIFTTLSGGRQLSIGALGSLHVVTVRGFLKRGVTCEGAGVGSRASEAFLRPHVVSALQDCLARFSDELVIVPINSLSFAASYVAPIALIDLITAGVGSLRREQVVGRLREADFEQKHGYRWYQTES